MTQPISHGYPDYGRYSATSDVLFLSINSENVNPSIDHGPFFMGGQEYVALTMSPDTKSFQYQLIWTTDAAGSVTLAIDGAIMPTASSNTLVFPVMGPWLTIRATPRTAPGAHGLRAFMVPKGVSSVGANATDTRLFATGFFNQGAASSQTMTTTKVFAGEAFVWSHVGAVNGQIRIRSLDLAGGFTELSLHLVAVAADPLDRMYSIMLPPAPIVVFFQNGGGVAIEMACTIIGRPFHGGR